MTIPVKRRYPLSSAEKEKVLCRAIKEYGNRNQIIKLAEEMSELTQALCKFISSPENPDITNNVYEEIADVEIMLQQFKLMYPRSVDKIQNWKNTKIERLALRLSEGK